MLPEIQMDLSKSVAIIAFDNPLSYFLCNFRVYIGREGIPWDHVPLFRNRSNLLSFINAPEGYS